MWISNKDGGISEGAVLVGYDHHGVDMYLARVSCGNNIFPAKLMGFLKTAHVAYGNKEICVRKYEVNRWILVTDTQLRNFYHGFFLVHNFSILILIISKFSLENFL